MLPEFSLKNDDLLLKVDKKHGGGFWRLGRKQSLL